MSLDSRRYGMDCRASGVRDPFDDAPLPIMTSGRIRTVLENGRETALAILASVPCCRLLSCIEHLPHGRETLNTLSPRRRRVFRAFADRLTSGTLEKLAYHGGMGEG